MCAWKFRKTFLGYFWFFGFFWLMPGAILFILATCFMVDRTKQPEGCIGISKKCVFTSKSLSSRYRELLKRFIGAIVLKKLSKDATSRAVGERRAEVFSLKKNKSTHYFLSSPHVFPCCFSPFRRITEQLNCYVFYGPISMKERFQFRLYNPQMYSNIFKFKSVRTRAIHK